MRFGLITTVDFANQPAGRLAEYRRSREFIEGLARTVGAAEGWWLHGAAATDGMSAQLVTHHDDAFAARATRHRIRTVLDAPQPPAWTTDAGRPAFGIVGLYSQEAAVVGLPRRKPVPHI